MKRAFVKILSCFALGMGCLPAYSTSANWFVSAGGGVQYPSFDSSTTISNNSGLPSPYNHDLYSIKNNNQPMIYVAAGRHWFRDSKWFSDVALGAYYQYSFASNLSGTVMQYSIPAFTNYTYHANVYSNMLLGTAQVDIYEFGNILPYLNVGLGIVRNTTTNYTETALPGLTASRTSPGFANNSDLRFAYQVGVGLDCQITEQTLMSIGYLYQNFGNVRTGNGTGSWSSQYLNLGSVHANTVSLGVTYLFNQ